MSELHREYHDLGQRLAAALPSLTTRAVFLPPLPPPGERGDCFGVLLLSDGSAGPFYVGLDGVLDELHADALAEKSPGLPAPQWLSGFHSNNLARQALALGAFNALSQSIMARAGFQPPPATRSDAPKPGDSIGMVGYFGRLARPWAAHGTSIRVLELARVRVEELPGIHLVDSATDLASCSRIICTSSVLVNQTLDEIIDGVGDAAKIELVGPSGSGLPDIPLKRGINTVGGVFFPDSEELFTALTQQGHWGKTGIRYTLSGHSYPSVDALLARL